MSPRDKAPNIKDVDPHSFGGQLRRFRDQAGLTQKQLGEALGWNQQRISSYELGEHMPEDEETIIALAKALGISPGTLFEATQFGGAIIVGEERREYLKRMPERQWRLWDRTMRIITESDPAERERFERTFERLLASWESSPNTQ